MASSGEELYRSFVESFVGLGDGVHFNWVVERGKYPDFPENDAANALLSVLSDDQRKTLAAMLVDARLGGIHDSLVVLHERFQLNGALLKIQPQKMEMVATDGHRMALINFPQRTTRRCRQ